MKKNVNLILLLVIASTLLLFSGFSAYYSLKLKNTAIERSRAGSSLRPLRAGLLLLKA